MTATGKVTVNSLKLSQDSEWKIYKNPSNALNFDFNTVNKMSLSSAGALSQAGTLTASLTSGTTNRSLAELTVKGDMFVGSGAGTVSKLGLGSNGAIMVAGSGNVAWLSVLANTQGDHALYTNIGTYTHTQMTDHISTGYPYTGVHVASPLSTKGDLWVRSSTGSSVAISIGSNTNDYELQVDNTLTSMMKWVVTTAVSSSKSINNISNYSDGLTYPSSFTDKNNSHFYVTVMDSIRTMATASLKATCMVNILFYHYNNTSAPGMIADIIIPSTFTTMARQPGSASIISLGRYRVRGYGMFNTDYQLSATELFTHATRMNLFRHMGCTSSAAASTPTYGAPGQITITAPVIYTGLSNSGGRPVSIAYNGKMVIPADTSQTTGNAVNQTTIVVYCTATSIISQLINIFYNTTTSTTVASISAMAMTSLVRCDTTTVGLVIARAQDGALLFYYTSDGTTWNSGATIGASELSTTHTKLRISSCILNSTNVPCFAAIKDNGDVYFYKCTQQVTWSGTDAWETPVFLYNAGTFDGTNIMSVMIGFHNNKLIVVSYAGSGTTLKYKICSNGVGLSSDWASGVASTTTLNADFTGGYMIEPVGTRLVDDIEFSFVAAKVAPCVYALDTDDLSAYFVSYYPDSKIVGMSVSPSIAFPVYNYGTVYVTGQNYSSISGHQSPDSVLLYRERYGRLRTKINYDLFMDANSLLSAGSNVPYTTAAWMFHKLLVFKLISGGTTIYILDNANVSI